MSYPVVLYCEQGHEWRTVARRGEFSKLFEYDRPGCPQCELHGFLPGEEPIHHKVADARANRYGGGGLRMSRASGR